MSYGKSGSKKEYEQPRSSSGMKPTGFKPKGKSEKPDMASQISGEIESKDSNSE